MPVSAGCDEQRPGGRVGWTVVAEYPEQAQCPPEQPSVLCGHRRVVHSESSHATAVLEAAGVVIDVLGPGDLYRRQLDCRPGPPVVDDRGRDLGVIIRRAATGRPVRGGLKLRPFRVWLQGTASEGTRRGEIMRAIRSRPGT